MKKIIFFAFLFFIFITFSQKNNELSSLYSSTLYDEINLQGEVLVNIGGNLHGIAIDDKMNIYVGKTKEIIKVSMDGNVIPFAMLENTFSNEYEKTFIYDIEFNSIDKCLYAASGNK